MILTEEQRREMMRKRLSARLNNWDHTNEGWSRLLLEVDALESHLAEAEETIKNLQWGKFEAENESSMKNDKIAELKSRLRAASELPNSWRGKDAYPTGVAQRWRRMAYLDCADELEAIVGEAEG